MEGFGGSGAQVALLADGTLPAIAARGELAILVVHAVNPYGFSHLRRVNEDNVDVNRNFVDFGAPLPMNPLYAKLHPLLLPATWPPGVRNHAALGAFVVRRGLRAVQAAISAGQYAFPDGLFYGGAAPCWSNRQVRALLRTHGRGRRRLGWIDVHSGLGAAGAAEAIHAGPDRPADLARTRAWWGPQVTSAHAGTSRSAAALGTMQMAAGEECPGVEFAGIVLEIGTVGLLEVLAALRAEHWQHNHPGAPPAQREAARARLRDAFYPATAGWQADAVAAVRRAVRAGSEALGA